MPLDELNMSRFYECLAKYRINAGEARWTRNELPKFYFANLLTRRVNLRLQTTEMILDICEQIEGQNYYYNSHPTCVRGIQFLPGTGESKFTEPITLGDVAILKKMAALEKWQEADFADRGISYSALSGWLGTLLPAHFMPVTSTLFRHTIAYLFNLEMKLHQNDDFQYFVHTQKYFYMTKRALRELDLDSLYLPPVSEYLKIKYPKSKPKTQYEEVDLNWLTQDFHTFIFREILRLDSNERLSMFDRRRRDAREQVLGFRKPDIARLYVP